MAAGVGTWIVTLLSAQRRQNKRTWSKERQINLMSTQLAHILQHDSPKDSMMSPPKYQVFKHMTL